MHCSTAVIFTYTVTRSIKMCIFVSEWDTTHNTAKQDAQTKELEIKYIGLLNELKVSAYNYL